MREKLGLPLRHVAAESECIASERQDAAFRLTPGRLHDIEKRGRITSIHRLWSLGHIYGCGLRQILRWYGIDAD